MPQGCVAKCLQAYNSDSLLIYTDRSMSETVEFRVRGKVHACRAGNSVGRTLSIGAMGVKANLG